MKWPPVCTDGTNVARPDLDKALCDLASWFGVVPGTDQPDGGPANEQYLRLPSGFGIRSEYDQRQVASCCIQRRRGEHSRRW